MYVSCVKAGGVHAVSPLPLKTMVMVPPSAVTSLFGCVHFVGSEGRLLRYTTQATLWISWSNQLRSTPFLDLFSLHATEIW